MAAVVTASVEVEARRRRREVRAEAVGARLLLRRRHANDLGPGEIRDGGGVAGPLLRREVPDDVVLRPAALLLVVLVHVVLGSRGIGRAAGVHGALLPPGLLLRRRGGSQGLAQALDSEYRRTDGDHPGEQLPALGRLELGGAQRNIVHQRGRGRDDAAVVLDVAGVFERGRGSVEERRQCRGPEVLDARHRLHEQRRQQLGLLEGHVGHGLHEVGEAVAREVRHLGHAVAHRHRAETAVALRGDARSGPDDGGQLLRLVLVHLAQGHLE
mmetsp:Transcript_99472/g.285750  ORF Transcript_99472/g.285750 Transcript_99472/m.285750 type:complete len:270 (-) Transcript_99472:1266-2075(-)